MQAVARVVEEAMEVVVVWAVGLLGVAVTVLVTAVAMVAWTVTVKVPVGFAVI